MTLWNTQALIDDFRMNRVSSRTRFHYFFLCVFLITVAMMPALVEENSGQWAWTYSAISLVSALASVYFAYRTNVLGDDKEFIDRFVCLSVPISLRLIVLFLPFFIARGLVVHPIDEFTIVDAVLFSLYDLAFLWRILVNFQKVSKRA